MEYELRKFGYPAEKGRVYVVRSALDMDYLRIVLDLEKMDFVYLSDTADEVLTIGEHRFLFLDQRILSNNKIEAAIDFLMSPETTIFCFCSRLVNAKVVQTIDLSDQYNTPFQIYAEASVRRAFRKSLFFSSDNGIWNTARTKFSFPHLSPSLEKEFIRSISSSRDILGCYDQVREFRMIRID